MSHRCSRLQRSNILSTCFDLKLTCVKLDLLVTHQMCFVFSRPNLVYGIYRDKNVGVDVFCVQKDIVREQHKDIEREKRIQAKQTWLCVAITYFHFSSQKFLKPSVPLFEPLHHSVQTNIRRKLEKSKRAVEGNRR